MLIKAQNDYKEKDIELVDFGRKGNIYGCRESMVDGPYKPEFYRY
jgi:hypothetical protein